MHIKDLKKKNPDPLRQQSLPCSPLPSRGGAARELGAHLSMELTLSEQAAREQSPIRQALCLSQKQAVLLSGEQSAPACPVQ